MIPPVRRRMLNLLTLLSLLLCVAVCVLWVRSYWHWDGLYRAQMSPEGMTWVSKMFRRDGEVNAAAGEKGGAARSVTPADEAATA